MTISELRIDSAVSNMAESLCLCRDSAFVLAPGVALHPVESEVIEGHGEGFPRGVPHPSSAPQPVGLPLERAGTSAERGTPPVSSVLPLTTRCRSLHRRASLSLRGWRPGCVAPFGCGSVVRARPRDDGYAFPGRRECRARVEKKNVHRVPILWGWTSGFSVGVGPPLVPFFPEVHEELTRLWKAPFTARNKSCSSSPLTTLDGGAALEYAGIPLVERSVAMQLCPTAPPCGVTRVSPHGPVGISQV